MIALKSFIGRYGMIHFKLPFSVVTKNATQNASIVFTSKDRP
jgi:hypothetical protein